MPQEIGIAKSESRQIIPVVLQPNLPLPGFISDLKYLDVPKNPQAAFTWLRDNVLSQAAEKKKQENAARLAIGVFCCGWQAAVNFANARPVV